MNAILSIRVFAIYLAALCILLVIHPNLILVPFGFEPAADVWPRVIGVLAGILSFYYLMAAQTANQDLIRWSVPARTGAFVAFVLFVVFGLAKPMLILFGAVDLAAAGWTWASLRRGA